MKWCLHFLPKTNENKSKSTKVEFVRSIFGRNVALKKIPSNLSDLHSSSFPFEYIFNNIVVKQILTQLYCPITKILSIEVKSHFKRPIFLPSPFYFCKCRPAKLRGDFFSVLCIGWLLLANFHSGPSKNLGHGGQLTT